MEIIIPPNFIVPCLRLFVLVGPIKDMSACLLLLFSSWFYLGSHIAQVSRVIIPCCFHETSWPSDSYYPFSPSSLMSPKPKLLEMWSRYTIWGWEPHDQLLFVFDQPWFSEMASAFSMENLQWEFVWSGMRNVLTGLSANT